MAINLAARMINQEAIDITTELLERLRSGETIAVAFIEVRRGGDVCNCFINSVVGSGEYHKLNSGAARLAARLANIPDDT